MLIVMNVVNVGYSNKLEMECVAALNFMSQQKVNPESSVDKSGKELRLF